MSKNLIIINQSGGQMDIDVANEAILHYNQVVLLGSCSSLERLPKAGIRSEKLIRFNKSSVLKRIWTWLVFSVQVFLKLLFKYRKWNILYYSNPPMACWASLLLKNKFSIMVYDIYPDALKSIGLSESNWIFKVWRRINRILFKKAEQIFTLSEGMKECLGKYAPSEKIRVIPLWSGFTCFRPIEKSENTFLSEICLQDKFIVLYSGNIGYTHSVEVIIEIADELKSASDVHFLIIGEGGKKAELVKLVESKHLKNVTFLPYQPVEILPYSIGSADVGVITLDDNVSNVSVPSKTFNLLAAGAPLLAIANEETEMGKLIRKYNCGKCIPKNDIHGMAAFITELMKNENYQQRLKEKALIASSDFTYKNAELYFKDF